ncbi:PleD family two-component response regulator [Bacillus fengqiuensis]|nr:PleD family two-component response regulator [Bacillus fengqiuensis]
MADDFPTLLAIAAQALYRAKREGRNRIKVANGKNG